MPEASGSTSSVTSLFAERDARRRRDREAAEQLQRRKEEELAEFRKRLDNFQLTDEIIQSGLDRIKRAFERGETELMILVVSEQLLHRRWAGDHQRRRAADQQAEQGRGGSAPTSRSG